MQKEVVVGRYPIQATRATLIIVHAGIEPNALHSLTSITI